MQIYFNNNDNHFMIRYYENDKPKVVNGEIINGLKKDKKEFKKLDLEAKKLNSTEWGKLIGEADKVEKSLVIERSFNTALKTIEDDRSHGKKIKNYSLLIDGKGKVAVAKNAVQAFFLKIFGGREDKVQDALINYLNSENYRSMRLELVDRYIKAENPPSADVKNEINKLQSDIEVLRKNNTNKNRVIESKIDVLTLRMYKLIAKEFNINLENDEFIATIDDKRQKLTGDVLYNIQLQNPDEYNAIEGKCKTLSPEKWKELEEKVRETKIDVDRTVILND